MDALMQDYITSRYAGAYAGLEHIPVGVDPDVAHGGDGARVRDRHDLGDAPLVLSIGHVIPLRDRVTLVEALPTVLRRHRHARAARGRAGLLRRLPASGPASSASATPCWPIGAVARADVPDYLAAADVETHDLQGYGLGTASLESMAAGVPVVAAVRPDNFPGVRAGQRARPRPGPGGPTPARSAAALADLLD